MFGKKKTDSEMLRDIYNYEKYLKTPFDERKGELFVVENLTMEDKILKKLNDIEKKLDELSKPTCNIKLNMPTSTPWNTPSEK